MFRLIVIMTVRLPALVIMVGAIGVLGCGDDLQSGYARDCSTDGIGCSPGFECSAGGDGRYACVPTTLSGDQGVEADSTLEMIDMGGGMPTCADNLLNGDESDVDCGGECGPCDASQTCSTAADCVSFVCDNGTCAESVCDDGQRNGGESDVDCGGACDACSDGKACAVAMDCESVVCQDERCLATSCADGVLNGGESGVDCGGECSPCTDGQGCNVAPDCQSGVCLDNACQSAQCDDFIVNGREADTDCGGDCSPCESGSTCNAANDCDSGVCTSDICQPANCDDSTLNGDEADIDCGGSCSACEPGATCNITVDCISGVCLDGMCQAARCDDLIINGDETDIDCGGVCEKCSDSSVCSVASDCISGVCRNDMLCAVAACNDGVQNGSETDIDCGGACSPCANGAVCADPSDCTSGVCGDDLLCAVAVCDDGVQNGSETDIDCGGACSPCSDGAVCADPSDCTSGVCGDDLLCAVAVCDDGVQNGGETDIDCGGACSPCSDGAECADPLDCTSGVCGDDLLCAVAVCDDGVQNGGETDIDCGGACSPCSDGAECADPLDCTSGVCGDDLLCAVAVCDDVVQNGSETDIDCGGACSPCSDGAECADPSDCVSGVCGDDLLCAVAVCDDGVQNGSETDIDCGGACSPCSDGAECADPSDCVSGVCGDDLLCAVAVCDDGVQNGSESDIDCGGDCTPCSDGAMCVDSSDCVSAVCGGDMLCAVAVCTDGVQNGSETDIDCGGGCVPCAAGNQCAVDGDCESGLCEADQCSASNCGNGQLEGDEECDDQNDDTSDGCLPNCRLASPTNCGAQPCDLEGSLLTSEAHFRQVLSTTDNVNGARYGGNLQSFGDFAVVAAQNDSALENGGGSVFVFKRDASNQWAQVQKLFPSNPSADLLFGCNVAISSDTIMASSCRGGVYVFTRDGNGNWIERQQISRRGIANGFGSSIAVDGDTAFIGSMLDGQGNLHVYTRDSQGLWSYAQTFTGAAAGDQFGWSIDMDGDTAIVGALKEDARMESSGSAYVFTRDGQGQWSQIQKLVADDLFIEDWFGYDVAISDDTIIIGTYKDDDNGPDSGSAFVFTRNRAGQWLQTQTLTASNPSDYANFGGSVAVGDGVIVVGAHSADGDLENQGIVYVFVQNEQGQWVESQALVSHAPSSNGHFGHRIDMHEGTVLVGTQGQGPVSVLKVGGALCTQDGLCACVEGAAGIACEERPSMGDGVVQSAEQCDDQNTVSGDGCSEDGRVESGYTCTAEPSVCEATCGDGIVVGAEHCDDGLNDGSLGCYNCQSTSGAACGDESCFGPNSVFGRTFVAGAQESRLPFAGTSQSTVFTNFGFQVTFDGDWAAVSGFEGSARLEEQYSGYVYVFRHENEQWQQVAYLTPPANQDSSFGYSIVLRGETLLVGAPFADTQTNTSGAVYVYQYNGNEWPLTQTISASDASFNSMFGYDLAWDGRRLLVGAPNASGSGVAYVFERSGNTFEQIGRLTATSPVGNSLFGSSVAIDGDAAVVGAPSSITSGVSTGRAYVFEYINGRWFELADLSPAELQNNDQFGRQVALSNRTAFVSALNQSNPDASGCVYTYIKNGFDWTPTQKLEEPSALLLGSQLSAGNGLIAVGTQGATGPVFIYRDIDSNWVDAGTLTTASVGEATSLALKGTRLLVGARKSGLQFQGAALMMTQSEGPLCYTDGICVCVVETPSVDCRP